MPFLSKKSYGPSLDTYQSIEGMSIFEQLQLEHSLFPITENHIDPLKKLAAKWQTIFPFV